ncbi:hypothetical protein BT93_E2394 [Corymbia citriodora subsp. variegata]|nr:hypothetical protein BT93_E2394 [Corymbia citriodora subsp. variegata]
MAFLVLVFFFPANRPADAADSPPQSLAWQGCPDTCGNLTNIPYPFGIGPNCFLDPLYEIDCQQNRGISTPVLKNYSVVVLDIQLPQSSNSPGIIKVSQPISYSHPNCTTNQQKVDPVDLMGSNRVFRYSRDKNYFVAGGCDNQALMVLDGCKSSCSGGKNGTLGFYHCLFHPSCCLTPITSVFGKYSVDFKTHEGEAMAQGDAECRFAFVVELAWWRQAHLKSLPPDVPVVLEWAITPYEEELLSKQSNRRHNNNSGSCQPLRGGILDCKQNNDTSYSCQTRDDSTHLFCACNPGYEGNYFLPQGCQDIDECKGRNIKCHGKCVNRPGSHYCIETKTIILIGVGAGVGVIVSLLLSWWLYKFIKRWREAKLKQKFFQRNGGLVLQHRLSSIEDNHKAKSKLFTSTELYIATDHFNENRILGQGRQGTVYKGMLTDGTIIVVKKSKVVNPRHVEEFINEVVILSEINHRNVVKLLGFCLESEVPLLVYEFVPNGTLYRYLHDPCGGFPISWEMRLRIANEIARALSYLHFAIPIYHCDIKSSNILLDKNYRAKVADFGASRSITISQTHLTTKVHGTVGYMDPEFFQTNKFTDKSDVYSFGVVLVELLTREKPISEMRAEEGIGLAMHFIISMEENHLFDVLDKEVLDHGEKEEIIAVSNLAKRCLNLYKRYRPTMKEVAMELERVRPPRNPMVILQNDEEINHIRTGSICPFGAVSTLARSEEDMELTSLEDDRSPFHDLPR